MGIIERFWSDTGDVVDAGEVQNYHLPAQWENGYKGPKNMEYPLADEYAIHKGKIALDAIKVSDITRVTLKETRHNASQTARKAWEKRLDITKEDWRHVAKLYTLPLLRHTDKHPHFKHITHRRIGTKNRFAGSPTEKCRLCNHHQENSCHLAWCPATKKIFDAIDAITEYTPDVNRTRKQKAKDRLFAYPGETAPDSLKTLYIIAWKYIIRDFYRVEFESYEYHYIPVLESTLMRFTTLAS